MKKAKLAVLALVAVSMFGGAAASSADPFGSNETGGQVTCGGTQAPADLFHVNATPTGGQGAQICNDGGPVSPVQGRITVYRRTSDGRVTVSSDGDPDTLSTWTRADANPTAGTCKVRVRRGTGDANVGGEPVGSTDADSADADPTC